MTMRLIFLAVSLTALPAVPASAQGPDLVGEYRLAEGPDVGGGMLIAADGTYQYGLAAGALDELSRGRWERQGDAICLITEPKPVPPVFAKAEPLAVESAVPGSVSV